MLHFSGPKDSDRGAWGEGIPPRPVVYDSHFHHPQQHRRLLSFPSRFPRKAKINCCPQRRLLLPEEIKMDNAVMLFGFGFGPGMQGWG